MISDGNFRKAEHLLKTKEFDRVYKKGSSRRAEGVVFCSFPNGLGRNRLGFSIGSKNVRRAVSRNRMRRLFREAYRKNKDSFKSGFDIVLVIRKDMAKTMSYCSAESILLKLAKDTGIAA